MRRSSPAPGRPLCPRLVRLRRSRNGSAAISLIGGVFGVCSIHNKNEQKDAVDACKGMELSKVWDSSDTGFDANSKHPVGCWIGLADTTAETAFSW